MARHSAQVRFESRLMLATTMLAAAAAVPMFFAQEPDVDSQKSPRELGAVRWGRRLEPALEEASSDGRPVLLLFQEVPG